MAVRADETWSVVTRLAMSAKMERRRGITTFNPLAIPQSIPVDRIRRK